MTDAVVVEYNTETREAIVETTDVFSRRYRVPMLPSATGSVQATGPTSNDACGESQQEEKGCTGGHGAWRVDNLFTSALLGRCVTIDPLDSLDAVDDDDGEKSPALPPARLVHMHEAGALNPKSMFSGTITRVAGRFVFIYCSFVPYQAVATREMFLTETPSVDATQTSILTMKEEATPVSVSSVKEEDEWVGRFVHFALHPMSFLVMEAFFAPSEMSHVWKRPSHAISACDHNRWLHPGYFFRPPLDERKAAVGEAALVRHEVPDDLSEREMGAWHVTGTDPCLFFHPELSVQFTHGETPLPPNAIPPMLYQKSAFTIQLWCFWMLEGTQVSLHVLDEDRTDVTDRVLCVEESEATERPVVMAHHLESIVVVTLKSKIRCFKMKHTVCEIQFLLRIKRGSYETQLESKSLFVRSRVQRHSVKAAITAGVSPRKRDVLSQKFWISDVLGPEDNIAGGFTDPGRSNELLTEERYDELPTVEREIIVVDPNDTRLQAIAAVARRAVLGIVDTIVCVQALTWLVASAYGGEGGGVNAEDEILSLRQQQRPKKRQRGGVKANEGVNVVLLGEIHNGVCRHRALLFKYLCDVVRLPCYLIRGKHQGPGDSIAERHSWNIVPLEGRRHLLVDATLSPYKLEMWPVSSYKSPALELNTNWSTSHCVILSRSSAKIHLLEECGRGATAIVRRGVLCGGLACAVKLPRTGDDVDRLVYEYEVLRKFRDVSHVVRCIGWSSGIVMEYFPTNLLNFMNHLITCNKRMSLSQQKEVIIGLLTALKDVHGRGYVHRDIKAENVLLVVIRCSTCHSVGTVCHRCDVRVKLADFADSVVVKANTLIHRASPCVGTPPYTAPEIEFEMPFSFAADVWSCGILAIEMAQMQLPSLAGVLEEGAGQRKEGRDNVPFTFIDDRDGMADVVPALTDDGRLLGHVCVPCLPRGPLPPKWQRQLVEEVLQVNWRKRPSAGVLLEFLKSATC